MRAWAGTTIRRPGLAAPRSAAAPQPRGSRRVVVARVPQVVLELRPLRRLARRPVGLPDVEVSLPRDDGDVDLAVAEVRTGGRRVHHPTAGELGEPARHGPAEAVAPE